MFVQRLCENDCDCNLPKITVSVLVSAKTVTCLIVGKMFSTFPDSFHTITVLSCFYLALH